MKPSHEAEPASHAPKDAVRKRFDADSRTLLRLWHEWDPILGGGVPEDEYDCQVAPMLRLLMDGADERKLADYLVVELATHFAITHPSRHEDFALRVPLANPVRSPARCQPRRNG